jgi:hypothetical protein
MASNASSWTLGPINANGKNPFVLFPSEEWPIDYCLAQQTDLSGKCQLQYSFVIMISVLIANAIKLTCMIFILRTHLEPILATIGDGIASFLERPDPFTVGRHFLNRQQARRFKNIGVGGKVRWYMPRFALRWWNAPSRPRWYITLTLCTITIIAVSLLLETGNSNLMDQSLGIPSPYSIGFGTPRDTQHLLHFIHFSHRGGFRIKQPPPIHGCRRQSTASYRFLFILCL